VQQINTPLTHYITEYDKKNYIMPTLDILPPIT